MQNFLQLNLPQTLLKSLQVMQFQTPTPIQARAIPIALQGQDILGSAQTGTGKTAAFGIPLVNHLIAKPNSCALILTPTRELATQVLDTLKQLLKHNHMIKTALLIGGDPMFKQLKQLRQKPRLIVGTPGRINDHLQRGSLYLKTTDFLVLDETDRMLDMGFEIQLNHIMKFLPDRRQTLMFSATLPDNIMKLAQKYLNQPERIAVGATNVPCKLIKQEIIKVSEGEKYPQLLSELDQRAGSIIVFVKTKRGADQLAIKLNKLNHEVGALHGDLRQNKRERVMNAFRQQKYRILVATDIAARGLDVSHIAHVINYDLPQCPEDYIHRIGRTARAGAEGVAVNLITPKDAGKWRDIHKLMNPNQPQDRQDKEERPQQRKKFKSKPSFSRSDRFSSRKEEPKRGFKKSRKRFVKKAA